MNLLALDKTKTGTHGNKITTIYFIVNYLLIKFHKRHLTLRSNFKTKYYTSHFNYI